MKKYIYLIVSFVLFTQIAAAKNDCDKHINDYRNKNYYYAGGVKAKMAITRQRECLFSKNPIYSNMHEFEQKLKYFSSIDGNFIVQKKLIDYQEEAEVFAAKGDIEKSSEYVDKFNDILIKRYDKILAAKILKEQVESGLISKAHKEELFKQLDEYLFKIGKCNPGICEGWGLISTVAGAFPKCAENSCQKNITYENLYFDLAKNTNNSVKATETIQKLLAKDFGTARSNGEVKAPLLLALSYIDENEFFDTAEEFLDKAKNSNLNYNYQDAILLPLITELMYKIDGDETYLYSYAKAPPYNIASMEASLQLLSKPISAELRAELRKNIEYFYEQTSACNTYSTAFSQGMEKLQQSSPAQLSKNPELDLFLRQRMQNAYWSDGFGNILETQASQNACVPSKVLPEDIDSFLVTSKIVKDFVREGFIDDIVLLPLFAFNKIKTVVKAVKQTPKLRISYINGEAIEKIRNARRVEQQVETNIQKLWEMPNQMAVGQDFMPGYNIGDRGVRKVTNSRSWRGGSPKKKAAERQNFFGNPKRPADKYLPDEGFLLGKSNKKAVKSRAIIKEEKKFYRKATAAMRHIGFEKSNKLAEELGMGWEELQQFMTDPGLSELLAKADPRSTDQIIKRIKEVYDKYYTQIINNSGHKFTFAYHSTMKGADMADIRLVEEVVEKNEYLKYLFKYGKEKKPDFLSDRWQFSPKNSKQSFDMYTSLLGCTPEHPCEAFFSDNSELLHIYSHDKSKMIRIAEHEYTISEKSSGLHFHYYELGEDYSINHRFLLDMEDPLNDLIGQSRKYLRELLLPKYDVMHTPKLINWNFRS